MLERPVVLFHKHDRTPVALEDRCLHRIVPLSRGQLVGDAIECGYQYLIDAERAAGDQMTIRCSRSLGGKLVLDL